jgi:RNA polymerase sigma-32 factor
MASRKTPKTKPKKAEVVDAEIVEETLSGEHRVEPSEPADLVEVPEVAALEDVEEDELEASKSAKALTVIDRSRSRDPMAAYMFEVTKHPLLTREAEVALARQYRETGDVKAAYRLVASNLRLVVKLAHEYHRNPMALLDLVQEGNIGLMQAVKKFDPNRGVKLSTYAAWWIRAYILRYIMDNWKMVKLGTTEAQRKLFFKLRQEQERLVAAGLEATPKLLAERLNVTEQDVVDMDQRLGNDELSIDAPVRGQDGEQVRADRLLPAAGGGAEEEFGNAELKALFKNHLDEFAKTLKEKERFIFEKRLMADEPLTLHEIGAQYGVSRERARQIESSLMDRMRKYMREKIPDFDQVAEGEPREKEISPSSVQRGPLRSGR